MDGRRVRAGLVLVLVVVALGAAGASMGDTGSGGGSAGLGDGSGSGIGEGESGIFQEIQELNPLFDGAYLTMAIGILAVVGALVAIVGLALGLVRWDWEEFLTVLREYGGKAIAVLLVFGVLYLLLQQFSPSVGGGSSGLGGEGNAEGAGAVSDATGLELPAILGVAVLVGVLVMVALMLHRSESEDDVEGEPEAAVVEGEPGATAPAGGGGPIGGAGVGHVAADNEVYRAWLALADAAGVDARRSTPGEVADRAEAAGVARDVSREITSLFELVRYGPEEPEESLEERARRARGRISGER